VYRLEGYRLEGVVPTEMVRHGMAFASSAAANLLANLHSNVAMASACTTRHMPPLSPEGRRGLGGSGGIYRWYLTQPPSR
jgi:ribulose-5-phosphate 4-epimerase/fuculose-1-phosphate aldolase